MVLISITLSDESSRARPLGSMGSCNSDCQCVRDGKWATMLLTFFSVYYGRVTETDTNHNDFKAFLSA